MNKKNFSQYKHIPETTGFPQQPYEGCTYCFIHEEAQTNVRFLSCDGHQLYECGVDLEVEGVRYIEMHRGPVAYVLGPPPSREYLPSIPGFPGLSRVSASPPGIPELLQIIPGFSVSSGIPELVPGLH